VNDQTNRDYIREVELFLHKVQSTGCPFRTMADRDWALAREIDDMCYRLKESFGRANRLVHGFLHTFPEHRGDNSLPMALRALRCWERYGGLQGGRPGVTRDHLRRSGEHGRARGLAG